MLWGTCRLLKGDVRSAMRRAMTTGSAVARPSCRKDAASAAPAAARCGAAPACRAGLRCRPPVNSYSQPQIVSSLQNSSLLCWHTLQASLMPPQILDTYETRRAVIGPCVHTSSNFCLELLSSHASSAEDTRSYWKFEHLETWSEPFQELQRCKTEIDGWKPR